MENHPRHRYKNTNILWVYIQAKICSLFTATNVFGRNMKAVHNRILTIFGNTTYMVYRSIKFLKSEQSEWLSLLLGP
jgi:hypothetical protein